MHSPREINCKCGTTYCFKCSKDTHRPCSCEMFEKWLRMNDTAKNDDKWIEANTKECPHCHQKIEKSKGCNYMLCDKKAGGCGHAFCYVCETDWAKHSQDHFTCNKYTDAVKKKEQKADQLKEQLKRTDFYYKRYMHNKKACEILDKQTREDIGEKINLLVTLKNMPQYWTEELHRYLIDDQLSMVIMEDNYTNFAEKLKNYKNSVNNIIESIEKYSKGLIDDIENNFISEIDYKLLDE